MSGHHTPPMPLPPTKRDVATWPAPLLPMLQRAWPTMGDGAPWPTRNPPTPQCIQPTLGKNVRRPMLSLSSPQRVWPTLGSVALWPMFSLLSPQRLQLTLGGVAPRPTLSLPSPQRVWLTLSGIAPWPTCPAVAAYQPRQPKPLLALQLPVNGDPPQAPYTSSNPACIANMQEQPHVAVAAKSGGQVGRGGGSSKATGRWFGLLPSVM